ncbi:MAG: DUF1667 domain-containing protein [Clostridia bacterium]
MIEKMTCVVCPRGCAMEVEHDGKNILRIAGNECKRGEKYANAELFNPTRIFTSTVLISGSAYPVLSVKTSKPVPKGVLFDCMQEVRRIKITSPVKSGDVIIHDILGTGADLVATADG